MHLPSCESGSSGELEYIDPQIIFSSRRWWNYDIFIHDIYGNNSTQLTKNKWNVTHSEEDGDKTIVEKQNIKLNEQKEQIKTNPHFAEVFKHFPQAEITSIEDKKSN